MTDEQDFLSAWAHATDPERDPVTGDDVRHARSEIPVAAAQPGSSRRPLLTVAAAVLLVAGVTAGVVVSRDTDGDRTVRSGTPGATTVAPAGGSGRLVVVSRPEDRGWFGSGTLYQYIEGAVGTTEVLRGDRVVAEARGYSLSDRTLLREDLPGGTYEISTVEASGLPQPQVDPDSIAGASEPCTTEVTVFVNQTVTVEIRSGIDDSEDRVACGFAIGTPTSFVLRTGDLDVGEEGTIHHYELKGPGGEIVAQGMTPANATTLISDRAVPRGRYRLLVEGFECPASCPDVGDAGRPFGSTSASYSEEVCAVDVEVGDESSVIVADVSNTTCRISTPADTPTLTVPPAWSLRPKLPNSCGASPPLEQDGDARRCFLRTHQDRRPMELVTDEPGIGVGARRVIFRTLDGKFQIIRPAAAGTDESWTGQVCDLIEAPAPEWAAPSGCASALPLEPN